MYPILDLEKSHDLFLGVRWFLSLGTQFRFFKSGGVKKFEDSVTLHAYSMSGLMYSVFGWLFIFFNYEN